MMPLGYGCGADLENHRDDFVFVTPALSEAGGPSNPSQQRTRRAQ